MALPITAAGVTFTTASGTKTVVATPAVGDLIFITTGHSGNGSVAEPTDNNPDGLGTYTLVDSRVKNTSADRLNTYVRDALIGSASSTTFTHAPGTTTGGGLSVLRIASMSKVGSAAIVKAGGAGNQPSASTPSASLGGTPASTNAIISAVFNSNNLAAVTARSGYTLPHNVGYNTPNNGMEVMYRASGETSNPITWGDTGASEWAATAAEINANHALTQSATFVNAATFYNHSVSATQALTPALFSNTNTFYTQVVSANNALTPDLFTSSPTFYSHTAAPGPVTLSPGLFTSSPSFYTHTVSQGAVTYELLASIIDSTTGSHSVSATPDVDDYIVLATFITDSFNTSSPTDDQGGTYNAIASTTVGSGFLRLWVRNSLVTSAVSHEFTYPPAAASGTALAVLAFKGMSQGGVNAVRQVAAAAFAAGTTADGSFSAGTLGDSFVIGWLGNADNPAGVNAPSGWAELLDSGYNTPTTGVALAVADSLASLTLVDFGTSVSAGEMVYAELTRHATLTPTRFVSSSIFYSHTIALEQALTADTFVSDAGFFTHTVTPGAVDLAASLFISDAAFYTHVAFNGVTLIPDLFVSDAGFYTHTLTPGVVDVSPSLFTASPGFYTQAISTLNNLEPELFISSPDFYTHLIDFSTLLLPDLFISSPVFYTHEVFLDQNLSGDVFVNTSSFYTPTVVSSNEILPALYTSSSLFYTHEVFDTSTPLFPRLQTINLDWLDECSPLRFPQPGDPA